MLGTGFDDAQRQVALQARAGLHVLDQPLFAQAR
jgi:hypothetical protein